MNISTAALFQYQPLEPGPDRIRLLQISRGQDSDIISCRLQNTTIDTDPYYALSYMWGPEGDERQIYINGKHVTVRRNLWLFLRNARKMYPTQKFWVDAVCIDQQNITERNQQVRIMGKLYRQAQRVIVWLGQDPAPGTQGIPRLFEVMNELDTTFLPEKPEEIPSIRNALTAVFELPYWSRTWIVQEISVAQNIVLVYKESTVEWGVFWASCRDGGMLEYLTDEERRATTATFLQSHLRTRVQCWHPDKIYKVDISSLLARYSKSQCSDQRDRIFGLLSLVDGGDQFPVDYNNTTVEVALKAYKLCSRPTHPFAFRLIEVLELSSGREFLYTIWQDYLTRLLSAFRILHPVVKMSNMAIRIRFLLRPCCPECVTEGVHSQGKQEPENAPILLPCFIPRSPSIHGFSEITMLRETELGKPLILKAEQCFEAKNIPLHNLVSVLLSYEESDLASSEEYLWLEAGISSQFLKYIHDEVSHGNINCNWTKSQLLQALYKHLHVELTPFHDNESAHHDNATQCNEHLDLQASMLLARWKAGLDKPIPYQAQHRDRYAIGNIPQQYLPLASLQQFMIAEESFMAEDRQIVERFEKSKR